MMTNPTVHVEATVIGHIAARQQADILVAARQFTSQRWWAVRDRYTLVVSQIVVDECSAGDRSAASERLCLIADIPILAVSPEAKELADNLMLEHGIPASEPRDALHIAIAAVNGIQYLATLNFTDIANAETRATTEQVCRDCGYVPPLICSPDELLGI
jgi:predicted nucleic acid-binding protein